MIDRRKLAVLGVSAGALALPAGAPAAPPVTPRPHAIQIAVPRDAAQPFSLSDAQLVALVQSAADFWRESSAGQIPSFTVNPTLDVLPAAGFPNPCDLTALNDGIRAVYPEPRFASGPTAAPEHLVVLVPDGCPAVGGLGTVGAARFASGGIVVSTTTQSVATARAILVHELGHNFGLSHAGGAVCSDVPGSEDTGACLNDPYFGYTEVMSNRGSWPTVGGDALPVLGAVYRDHFGLEAAGESVSVGWTGQPAQSVFEYDLRPRADATGLRSIRVTDPHTGRRYVVEYRSGTGLDAGTFYAGDATFSSTRPNGQPVTIATGPGVAIQEDLAPSDDVPTGSDRPTWIYDVDAGIGNFAAGRTWMTPNRGLEIHVGEIVAGVSAHVRVTVYRRHVSATAPPTVSGRAQVGQTLSAAVTGWRPVPTHCDYQWLAGDAAIAGAVGATFVVGAGQVGARLRVRATCEVAGAAPVAPLTSAATAAVTAADPPAPGGGGGGGGGGSAAPPAASVPSPSSPEPVSAPSAVTPTGLAVSTVTATVAPSTYGRAPRVQVAVTSPGATPEGVAHVRQDGRLLASGPLAAGRATLALPATLAAGRQRLTIEYAGGAGVAPARTTVTAVRRKLAVRAIVAIRGTSVRVAAVSSNRRLPATGTVAVSVDGEPVRRVSASRTARSVSLPQLTSGRHRVTVRYEGSATHAATSRSAVLTV